MTQALRKILNPMSTLGVVVTLLWAQSRIDHQLRHETTVAPESPSDELKERGQTPVRLPNAFLKAALGGLLPLYVDWSWIRVLADDTLTRLPRHLRTQLFHALDEVTDLDPAFFQAYSVGGDLLAIIRDDVYGAKSLLERGENFRKEKLAQQPTEIRTQTWKNDWRIPFQLGYVHLLELNDLPTSETYFSEAREHPEAPLYVRKIGERLGSPEGRFAVARNVLNALLEQAKNQNATNSLSQELELKIQDLALAEFFFFANRTLEQRAAESGSLSPKSNASSITKLTLESREQLFNRLVQSGLIPALDPLGARVEFRSTEDAPNGKVTSSTPRRPVMGIQP